MSKLIKPKIITVAILAFMFGMLSVAFVNTSFAASENDIIRGGISTEADIVHALHHGSGPHSAANIQSIMREAIGVQNPQDFQNMTNGHVHKDGRVTVNGETVATNAESTGRLNFRNSRPLGDTGAYIHRTDVRFSQGVDKIAALVKLDDKGEYMYSVLKNCGNPVRAQEVPVKVVEKEVEVIKEVEKEVVVEKPVEKIVEKEVVVEKPVEKIVEVEKEVEEIPKVGPSGSLAGSVAGLFSVTTLAGTVAHRIFAARRGLL